jgi:chemotaxis protein MotB
MMYTASVPDEARMQWILRSFANVAGNVADFTLEDEDQDPFGNTPEPHLVGPHSRNEGGEVPGIAGVLPMTFDDLFNWVSEIVEAHDLTDSVSVEMYQGRMHIRFDDDIMFDPESAALRQSGMDALRRLAPGISAINNFIEDVEVAGHTAPPPPGVNPARWGATNPWVLSTTRATNVTVFLDSVLRMVDSHKFMPTGHGPHNPHYDTTNEESNRRNRRIELILTRSDYNPDDTPSMLDMLMYDYMFPILPGGPLNNRQPCPDAINRHDHIWHRLMEQYRIRDGGESLSAPQAPTPSDGRGHDFSIPTVPRAIYN